MNLYDFHDKPKELAHHDKAHEQVPIVVWDKIKKQFNDGKLNLISTEQKEELMAMCRPYLHVIAKDGEYATEYAMATEQRFKEGEPAILKNLNDAYWYTRFCLEARWPEYEKQLLKSDRIFLIMKYITDVIDGPWPAAEDKIAQDGELAFKYATKILNDRFLKGEPAIEKSVYRYKYKEYFGLNSKR